MPLKIGKGLILRVASVLTAGVVVAALIIGDSIVKKNESNLDSILCPPIVHEDSLKVSKESGQKMAQQIIEEGAVLLKNNNHTLPLKIGTDYKLNVFGWASIDWAYGANSGSCSGRVMAEDSKRTSLVDLYDALTLYGIEYNSELKEMYERYADPYVYALKDPGSVNNTNVITLHEPDINDYSYYSDALLDNAERYSRNALVVITRNAGEDIPADRAMNKAGKNYTNEPNKIYLDLSIEEKNLLTYVGQAFEKVIVIINSPAQMDLAFLNTIKGLDAALQVGFTGTHGAEMIPALLYGEKNPSGHLVDTFAYDRNYSFAFKAKNAASFNGSYLNGKKFFEYVEGIYVGYRWYETADAEHYWRDYTRTVLDEQDKEVTKTGYEAVVQYPFGYGLSYTNFEYHLEGTYFTKNGEEIPSYDVEGEYHIKLKVTNTGEVAGKDVAEVYLEAPYYRGRIEKSAKALVGFEKTVTLEPGKSEILDIEVQISDCMSYDCYDMNFNNHTGYELEKGTYKFHLGKNSHEDIEMTTTGSEKVQGLVSFDVAETIKVTKDKYTGHTVKNLFTGEDAVDGYPIDGVENNYEPEYISRTSFPDVLEYNGVQPRAASAKLNDVYFFDQAKGDAWDNATTDIFGNPVYTGEEKWGVDHGLRIAENGIPTALGYKLGANYDDPEWQNLLEQLSFGDVTNTMNMSYGTPAVDSVGKPKLNEVDGPAQIKCYYQQPPRGTGYPSAVVIAQTWNKELAEDFGLSFAMDMNSVSINGLWGWGCNLHRTPVGGRNWEYFSEDPFMSGKTLAGAVKGLLKGGRYSYIKHFCMNESETSKKEGFTFVTEQAYRECYLKPFQMGIQEGGAVGIMTSFNRIGALYSGGSEASITGVVRNEWGFKGAIITDWADNGGSYMSIDHQFRAGGDLGMNTSLNGYSGAKFNYNASATPRVQHQMKEVMHHVLYSWLRCQYLNKQYNENPESKVKVIQTASIESYKWYKTLLVDVNILLGGGALIFLLIAFLPVKKKED